MWIERHGAAPTLAALAVFLLAGLTGVAEAQVGLVDERGVVCRV